MEHGIYMNKMKINTKMEYGRWKMEDEYEDLI
jgi:hypothetical protein